MEKKKITNKERFKRGLISSFFGVFLAVFIFSILGICISWSSVIIGSCIGGFGMSYLRKN